MKLRFTKKSLDSLPASDKGVAYHYDTECRGLAIGVGKSGRKSFVYYRKVDRRPVRFTLGRYPDLPIEEARRRTAELNGKVAAGDFPIALRQVRPATFRQAFEKYYIEYSSIHKITHLEDLAHFNRHIDSPTAGALIADKPLPEITQTDIRLLHTGLGAKKKETTANRIVALISSVFNRTRAWGLFDGQNPCQGLKKYQERSRERFVRPGDEMHRFLKALELEPALDSREFFLTALLTGARKSNVLAMEWSQIDSELTAWGIPRTKNGDSQVVHISQAAREILVQRRARASLSLTPEKYVFPGTGKTGHLVEPRKAWERVLDRATAFGVLEILSKRPSTSAQEREAAAEMAALAPASLIKAFVESSGGGLAAVDMRDLHMHDLRRTLGSWLASRGVSLPIIGKALNHRTTAATQVYARVWNDAVKDAVELAGTAMMNQPVSR